MSGEQFFIALGGVVGAAVGAVSTWLKVRGDRRGPAGDAAGHRIIFEDMQAHLAQIRRDHAEERERLEEKIEALQAQVQRLESARDELLHSNEARAEEIRILRGRIAALERQRHEITEDITGPQRPIGRK